MGICSGLTRVNIDLTKEPINQSIILCSYPRGQAILAIRAALNLLSPSRASSILRTKWDRALVISEPSLTPLLARLNF
jgi:hypothetical protein